MPFGVGGSQPVGFTLVRNNRNFLEIQKPNAWFLRSERSMIHHLKHFYLAGVSIFYYRAKCLPSPDRLKMSSKIDEHAVSLHEKIFRLRLFLAFCTRFGAREKKSRIHRSVNSF